MATIEVAVLNEDRRPLKGVTVEAIHGTTLVITATAVTGDNGIAVFTLTTEHFFRPRVRRTSVTVGDQSFTGEVEVQIVSGGLGPVFCHDYLTSTFWTGTEGQKFSTLDGGSFRVFSTVEGSTDHGIANLARAFSVFCCPGTYVEDLEIATFAHEIHIHGAGRDVVIIGGNTVNSHRVGATKLFLYDLTLTGPVAGYSLTQLPATANMVIHTDNVSFARRMAGDHVGSVFTDSFWPAGIQFEATDTPDTVQINGGSIGAPGIDFTIATGNKSGWDVRCLMIGNATLNLRNVVRSKFDLTYTASSLNDQVFFEDADSVVIELKGRFAPPGNGGQVIRVGAGIKPRAINVRSQFTHTTGLAAGTNFIDASAGIARAWHIDCAFGDNSLGNFLEDDGGISVRGVFIDSKFTLVPTDAQIETLAGSDGNKVDSGVIVSGSIGIATPGENLIEIDLGSAVDGVPIVV